MSSADRALINAFREIGNMGDRLNLPKMIAVSRLYRRKLVLLTEGYEVKRHFQQEYSG
jgi:hypothetical protein